MPRGQVKVAKYDHKKSLRDLPQIPDYKNILIHTSASNLGGDLSPYNLCDDNGCILENLWQFSKVYPKVIKQCQMPLMRYGNDRVTWEHPAEVHLDKDGEPTPKWYKWRDKGYANPHPVRYPNGFQGRHNVAYALWNGEKLDYIEARKKIYCDLYVQYAPHTAHFKKLKRLLENGQNLCIWEVDGPDYTLDYFPYTEIDEEHPGLTINKKVIRALINDENKPFGHGFVIASLLLNGADWLK